jgi:hypothetical protein
MFVGTVNEDETTQTLSDKVVDRANVISFGKPPELSRRPTNGREKPARPKQYLPYAHWQQWVRKDADLPSGESVQIDRWIDQLNEAMSMIRKPFAFRTHLAMRSYAANYPEQGEFGLRCAMADQLEQKILPKFRGLDPNDEPVSKALDRLLSLVDEWEDLALMQAIENSRRDGMREHQFIFQHADRLNSFQEAGA